MADDSSSFLHCKRLTTVTSLLLSKFINVISKLMSLSDTSLVSVFVLYLFLEGRMMRCTWIPPIKMQKHAVVITSHYLIVSFTCTRKEKKKNEDDYCNLPTIIFCADAFPAHRCPFIKFFVN